MRLQKLEMEGNAEIITVEIQGNIEPQCMKMKCQKLHLKLNEFQNETCDIN